MRTLLISLLASTSVSALADDHYYAGFELGATISPDKQLTRDADGLNADMGKNLGSMLGLYVGKKRGKQRFELEYLLRKNYFDEAAIGAPGSTDLIAGQTYDAGGLQQTDSIMANVWHAFVEKDTWSLLGGLGLGLSHIELDGIRRGQNRPFADETKWAPAVQAMAQVTTPVGSGMEFGVGYRYFQALASDFDTINYKAKNHEVFARLSWRFGEAKAEPKPAPAPVAVAKPAPAPAPAPAPKPEPKPVPLPGPFMVFFDFDKTDITADAASIIKTAAAAFKKHKAVEIHATGHTDRAGRLTYNVALSEKRAQVVKDALIAEGVSASSILIEHKGEASPMVGTEDGVREWQNRRVEIKLVR